MESFRNPENGRFLLGEKPHNAGLIMFFNPETNQTIYLSEDPGPPWVKGTQNPPPSHKGSKWFHNPSTKERKRFTNNPGDPWVEGRGKTGFKTTNGKSWYYNPESGVGKLFDSDPGIPWVKKGIPHGYPGWVEGVSRQHCRRWNCDSIYLLKMTSPEGLTFGKWGSSTISTFRGRENEFKKKRITWEVIYWGWFGEFTEELEAKIGRRLSKFPSHGVPKFYGYTETFEWSEVTQKLLQEIINGLEENPAP
jgi:hypothetical protein